jgi:DNA-binding NarL/FixJ family response regulator
MYRDQPIRVLVVDDHPAVREALTIFLDAQPDIVVVGQASSGMDAVSQCRTVMPDIVLMDMAMPGMDGVDASRAILQASPRVQVIMLSSYNNETLALAAERAGAAGYLSKSGALKQLIQLIRVAANGNC